MKILNSPILTLFAALLLAWLIYLSWPKGYTPEELTSMDTLIANTVSPMTNNQKMVFLYGQ